MSFLNQLSFIPKHIGLQIGKNRLLITNSNKNCVCYDKVLFIEKMN
jgi:hypothetical protein